jgi:hypothetical protein
MGFVGQDASTAQRRIPHDLLTGTALECAASQASEM